MQLSAFIGHLRLAGIYDRFKPGPEVDLQGRGSQHEIFERLIDELRPNSIIELGSWKGASAVHMARLCRARGLNCIILCIDTWLGGRYLYAELDQHPELLPTAGRFRLFEQFLTNVKRLELTDIITPMPATTADAAGTLRKLDVAVDLVYVDASHEAEDVAKDLRAYWDVVRPGGVLFGDDYAPPGRASSRPWTLLPPRSAARSSTSASNTSSANPRHSEPMVRPCVRRAAGSDFVNQHTSTDCVLRDALRLGPPRPHDEV
jgi:predicted O-methyltransferase YrrM